MNALEKLVKSAVPVKVRPHERDEHAHLKERIAYGCDHARETTQVERVVLRFASWVPLPHNAALLGVLPDRGQSLVERGLLTASDSIYSTTTLGRRIAYAEENPLHRLRVWAW